MEDTVNVLTEEEGGMPEVITFELKLDEANLVLAALQELPHKVVHPLITNLLEQANRQVKK